MPARATAGGIRWISRDRRAWGYVIAAEGQLRAIGHGDLVGHLLAGQFRESTGAGQLHLVVDRAGVDIERAAEEIGEIRGTLLTWFG